MMNGTNNEPSYYTGSGTTPSFPPASSLYNLIEKRCQGRLSSLTFSNQIKRKRSLKCLSRSDVIHSTERTITSLQIHPHETRFLITGSASGKCTVYDLFRHGGGGGGASENKNNYQSKNINNSADTKRWIHKPIAQTNPHAALSAELLDDDNDHQQYDDGNDGQIVGGGPPRFVGPVTATKWFPTDSGAFLSSHVSGSLVLWDTNAMVPVLQLKPFAADVQPSRGNENDGTRSAVLSTIETSTVANPHLVAAASIHVSTIRLVDLRSGAAAHSLLGHRGGGVTSLAWSPRVPYVLASGGYDGTVRLWDIRKAGRHAWIGGALDMDPPSSLRRTVATSAAGAGTSPLSSRRRQSVVNDPLVRSVFCPDYSHWVRDSMASRSSFPGVADRRNYKSRSLKNATAPIGPNDFSERKTTVSHQGCVTSLAFDGNGHHLVSHGLDNCVRLWDLQTRQCIPRQFALKGGSNSNLRVIRETQLLIPRDADPDDALWIAQGSNLYQYDLHQGGNAKQCLTGHLKRVRAVDYCPDTGNIVTGGADGVCLLWGPKTTTSTTASTRFRTGSNRNKRKLFDEDNW